MTCNTMTTRKQFTRRLWKRIADSDDAEAYCRRFLAGRRKESTYMILLNAQDRVIGRLRISKGNLFELDEWPRCVVGASINYGATAVVLCRSYPCGLYSPTGEDIEAVRSIQALLHEFRIKLVDYILVEKQNVYSMKQNGKID